MSKYRSSLPGSWLADVVRCLLERPTMIHICVIGLVLAHDTGHTSLCW